MPLIDSLSANKELNEQPLPQYKPRTAREIREDRFMKKTDELLSIRGVAGFGMEPMADRFDTGIYALTVFLDKTKRSAEVRAKVRTLLEETGFEYTHYKFEGRDPPPPHETPPVPMRPTSPKEIAKTSQVV